MIEPRRMEELQAFLGRLPDAVAVRLACALEYDRLEEFSRLPHAAILDALRPALRRTSGIVRVPTPLRVFCRPCEDLLVDAPAGQKQKGRIARDAIPPVWDWLEQTLLPEETARFVAHVKDSVLRHNENETKPLVEEFWAHAAAAIRAALADTRAARAVLGSDAVVADAGEIALLLSVGPEIAELQRRFPRALPALTEDFLWVLRGTYDGVVASCADAAPYVAVIAMNRLAHPWEALKLPLMVARQNDDTLVSNTDMGLVGEILFDDLDAQATDIRAARRPQFDPDALTSHVARFAALSEGIDSEIALRREGRWSQRLFGCRAAVAEFMDDLVRRSARDVVAALPTVKSGAYAGGPAVPDVSHAPDDETVSLALNGAALIARCRDVAAGASFGAALLSADEEITHALKAFGEGIVRELRACEHTTRAFAETYCEIAARLTAVLFSPEEAEFLRRRGRAACNSGAQAA